MINAINNVSLNTTSNVNFCGAEKKLCSKLFARDINKMTRRAIFAYYVGLFEGYIYKGIYKTKKFLGIKTKPEKMAKQAEEAFNKLMKK